MQMTVATNKKNSAFIFSHRCSRRLCARRWMTPTPGLVVTAASFLNTGRQAIASVVDLLAPALHVSTWEQAQIMLLQLHHRTVLSVEYLISPEHVMKSRDKITYYKIIVTSPAAGQVEVKNLINATTTSIFLAYVEKAWVIIYVANEILFYFYHEVHVRISQTMPSVIICDCMLS